MLNNLGLSAVKMCTVLPYFAGEQGCSQAHPCFRFAFGHRYFARCFAASYTSYEYDVFSGLLKKVTDVIGTETHYTYNAFGKRTSVYTDFISANGNRLSSMCGFTYNDDYLVGVEYHGDTYRFSFDGFGKPLGVKVNEVPLVSYEYEKNNGNRNSISYASGQSYTYEYDSLNRITKICYKDASETSSELLYSYEYDKNGNLALSTDHIEDVIYYYYYDLSERLVKTADSRGNYEIYYYDDGNNVIKLESGDTSKTKIVEFTYDEDNRETGVKVNGKNYVSTYDKLGRISKRAWNTDTPLNISYEYAAGADGSQTALMSSYSNNNATISYTYDSKNNMTSISDKSGTSKYYYDEINQLYREDNHILNQTIVYNYDVCGNILDKKIYDKTNEEKISGEPKQVITYTYADDWKDKLISYDGKDITYDASGNPLIFLDKQMTGFRDNRLKTIKNDTIDMSYTYDEDGYRIKKANHKTGSTTDYVISGSLILSEITKNKDGNVSENLECIYDSYGNVIAFTYNNMPYYYMKNGQRDIVGIIDGTGKIIVTYTYDSWGNVISVDGDTVLGNSNPFRYRSYYYDKESNLYYLNSRYYSPEIGRFINADDTDALINNFDSALDGRNLFAYCNNNPITHWDTTGELIDTLFDVASLIIGIGEVIEGFKAAYNVADKAHDVKKMSGSYTIHYASGHFYDGKGSVKRAVTSAKKSRSYKDKKTGMDQKDTVVGIEWSSAPNHKQAFIDEYDRMNHHGYGDSKKKNNMYNKIWSPGRKLTCTGLASERKFVVTCRRKLV